MNEHTNLQKLVNDFVADLLDHFRRSAIAALTDNVGGNGNGNGKGKLNGLRASNGHGVKRAPEDLERLSESFVAFVSKHPGLRIEQINKEIGTSTKELALPIRKLVAEKRVKVKGKKRSTTYYAA